MCIRVKFDIQVCNSLTAPNTCRGFRVSEHVLKFHLKAKVLHYMDKSYKAIGASKNFILKKWAKPLRLAHSVKNVALLNCNPLIGLFADYFIVLDVILLREIFG